MSGLCPSQTDGQGEIETTWSLCCIYPEKQQQCCSCTRMSGSKNSFSSEDQSTYICVPWSIDGGHLSEYQIEDRLHV